MVLRGGPLDFAQGDPPNFWNLFIPLWDFLVPCTLSLHPSDTLLNQAKFFLLSLCLVYY